MSNNASLNGKNNSRKNNSMNASMNSNKKNNASANASMNSNKKNVNAVNIAKNAESNSAVGGKRRKTRRSKGGSCGCSGGAPMQGGKRKKTRRMSKGGSDWNKKMMEVYREMKKMDASIKLGDAMKEAARRKQRGEL